jgi:hypothetical protein
MDPEGDQVQPQQIEAESAVSPPVLRPPTNNNKFSLTYFIILDPKILLCPVLRVLAAATESSDARRPDLQESRWNVDSRPHCMCISGWMYPVIWVDDIHCFLPRPLPHFHSFLVYRR